MQKKSKIKFLLIGIFLILFLLIGGNVKAADGVLIANTKSWGFFEDDKVGGTLQGTYKGADWKATVMNTDDGSAGTVSIELLSKNFSGELEIPKKVEYEKTIGTYTYNVIKITDSQDNLINNPEITSIVIPETIAYIDNEMVFNNCTKLQKIEVNSNNTKYLSENGILFNKEKTSLLCYPRGKTESNYTIPEEITMLGKGAFKGAIIQKIEFSSRLTSISAQSFMQCKNLKNVTIPNTITDIGIQAFKESGIQKVQLPETLELIEASAFFDSDLVEINIPNTIDIIYETTFANCSNLAKVTMSNEIKTIKKSAFGACISLTNINLGTELITIEEKAFYNCIKLKNINIPNTVTTIGTNSFAYCNSFSEVIIPEGVTTLGIGAFAYCTSLKNITLPTTVTTIGEYAFLSSKLENIEIPKAVTKIGKSAFQNSSNLKSVVVSNAITTVGTDVFKDCNNDLVVYCTPNNEIIKVAPAYIVYEETVEEPKYIILKKYTDASGKCTNLEILNSIYGLPVQEIGTDAFKEILKLKYLTIPENLKTIGANAFKNCKLLTTLIIPKKVTTIGANAFSGSELSKIVIKKGSSIETLGNGLFKDCSSIPTIYHDGANAEVNTYKTNNTDANFIIDVKAPTGEIEIQPNGAKEVKIAISNFNDEGSGTYKYAISSSSTEEGILSSEWKLSSEENISEIVKENGTKYIYFQDMIGNTTRGLETPITGIDESVPVIDNATVDIVGGKDGATVKATVTDAGGSALAGYAFATTSDATITEWKQIQTEPLLSSYKVVEKITIVGDYYLYVKDGKGNIGISSKIEITNSYIDNILPEIGSITKEYMLLNNEKFKVKLSTTVADAGIGLSGYSLDTISETSSSTVWKSIETPAEANITEYIEANGTYYLHVKDKYGNIKTTLGINIAELKDKIAPTIEFGTKTNETVEVRIKDAFSGIATGAEIGYGWSDQEHVKPTSYATKAITYEAGTKDITFTVSMVAGTTGTKYLWIKVMNLKDVAGNSYLGEEIESSRYIFDTEKPIINTIVKNKNKIKERDTLTYTITFSEVVTLAENHGICLFEEALGEEEIAPVAEITEIRENSGTEKGTIWLVTVKGGIGNGIIELNIPANSFKDEAGNILAENGTGNQKDKQFIIDNEKPIIKFEKVSTRKVKLNGTATYTINIIETVTKNESEESKIKLEGTGITGTITSITLIDGKWQIEVKGGTGDGDVKLKLPAGLFTDGAGNVSEAIDFEGLKFDNTAPEIIIGAPNTTLINKDGIATYTIQSKNQEKLVQKPTIAVLTGTGITGGTVTISEKTEETNTWEAKVTNALGDGSANLVIPRGTFVDEAGNEIIQTVKDGLTIDNIEPTITNVSEGNLSTDKKKIEFYITTSIVETGGKYAASPNETPNNVNNWNDISVNPIKAEVSANGIYYIYVKDKAGNVSKYANPVTFSNIIDNTEPTITVTEPSPKIIKAGGTTIYQIVASEAVTKVEGKEATLTGAGSVGSRVEITGTGSAWIATVTAGNTSGAITLNIPTGFFQDTAGNKTKVATAKEGIIVDVSPATATVAYAYNNETQGIKIEITANEELQPLSGWVLSENKKALRKETKTDITSVIIKDLAGNETTVDVNVKFATAIDIDGSAIIEEGKTKQLTLKKTPTDARGEGIIWESSNSAIATVNSSGLVTAVKAGTATITAKSLINSAIFDNCIITVTEEPEGTVSITGVTLDVTTASLEVGGTKQLAATVAPTNATNKAVTWSSSDSSVATVSNSGLVTAVKAGTATITAKSLINSAIFDNCIITVTEKPEGTVSVIGVTLDVTTASLEVGGTKQLAATVAPTNATNKAVTWNSSDSSVVTVSNSGLVTAVKAGTATITVTSVADSTKKATCIITVGEVASGFIEESGYIIKTEGSIKYLVGISAKTTIETLISKKTSGYTVTVKTSEETEITDKTKFVGTEMKIIASNGTNTIIYIAVVTGDCTGDGETEIKDIFSVNKHRLQQTTLLEAVKLAADVNNDNVIDIKDIFQINKYRLAK